MIVPGEKKRSQFWNLNTIVLECKVGHSIFFYVGCQKSGSCLHLQVGYPALFKVSYKSSMHSQSQKFAFWKCKKVLL